MSKETILIVDDSPTALKMAAGPLRAQGYRILTAVDGEQAIQVATAQHPDLIVLDVILPKKNGFQVCRQLRADPGTKDIKIVLLTSKNQSSDRSWGIQQGADQYITKPFGNDELLAKIVGLLGTGDGAPAGAAPAPIAENQPGAVP